MSTAERLLPILKDTGCKVGQHIFVTIGRLPADGDYCRCELMRWDDEKQTAVDSNQDSSVHALRDRLYAALRHEKSCTCGECSGGLNAVDDLVEQLEAAQRDNGRLALEAATADQDWKRAEAEANKLRHALTQVRAECNLPDYIAEFVGEALTPSSPNVRKSWGPERMRHDPEAS